MPIQLSQYVHPDRFVARHWMLVPIERVTQPPNPPAVPYRGQIILSGVVLIDLKGTSSDQWLRDRVFLDLGEDLSRALNLAPWAPRPGNYWATILPEQWIAFATVNSRFNEQHAINDGTAADAFGMQNASRWWIDVAVRDTDAWIYRLAYHVTLYGAIEDAPKPGG